VTWSEGLWLISFASTNTLIAFLAEVERALIMALVHAHKCVVLLQCANQDFLFGNLDKNICGLKDMMVYASLDTALETLIPSPKAIHQLMKEIKVSDRAVVRRREPT